MRPSLNISRFFFFQERHDALEQMGVSVETSGIKVETGKYFLVNLNADPSLNELLVYYLKVGENISFYRIFNFFLCVDFVSFQEIVNFFLCECWIFLRNCKLFLYVDFLSFYEIITFFCMWIFYLSTKSFTFFCVWIVQFHSIHRF